MDIRLTDIGNVIQSAIAPVFLQTGVGTMLVVLTNPLARIIDRMRALDDLIKTGSDEACITELQTLHRRGYLINLTITLSTICGLFICVVVAMLFLSDTTDLPLDQSIAGCFVLTMVALIGTFVYFLREVLIGTHHMRMQQLSSLRR
jgi:hypothetical protein